jgi:hypothetical protein
MAASALSRVHQLPIGGRCQHGVALLLASVGIYRLVSYSTALRVPEIGIRMALAATGLDIVALPAVSGSTGLLFAPSVPPQENCSSAAAFARKRGRRPLSPVAIRRVAK